MFKGACLSEPPCHVSKGAVRLIRKIDALIYAADCIRVNSIYSGFIWTPMVENVLKSQGNVEVEHKAVDAQHLLRVGGGR